MSQNYMYKTKLEFSSKNFPKFFPHSKQDYIYCEKCGKVNFFRFYFTGDTEKK